MADLSTTTVTSSGYDITANGVAADVAGDTVEPGTLLAYTNGDASSTDVTLVTPQTVDGDLEVEDRVVTVAASATSLIRVPSSFRDPETGLVDITYTSVTSLTVAVVK